MPIIPGPPRTPTSIRLRPDVQARLDAFVARTGAIRTSVINLAVHEYLERNNA